MLRVHTNFFMIFYILGGWNNIRMAIEIIFIFAAVTNRTIVLPPKQDIYLLKTKHHLDFTDFFALDRFMNNNNTNTNNNKVLTIISAEEFINRECHYKNGRFPIPEEKWNVIESISKVCENRKKSMYTFLYSFFSLFSQKNKTYDIPCFS